MESRSEQGARVNTVRFAKGNTGRTKDDRAAERARLLFARRSVTASQVARLLVVVLATLTLAPTTIAAGWPTTVDLGAVGPEARTTDYGVQHPGHFDYAPIPIGFTATASDVTWQHWGEASTIGTGYVQFCVNMSPCYAGAFTMRLYRPRFARCPDGHNHLGYTRASLNVAKEHESRPLVDAILVGCRTG